MFSKAVVGSARFMKMPVDSQNLYFHLGMAADDDGVVEAWSVLKTTGSAEDNLKVLASKGFIRVLNEDFVSYILDWNEHNLLRSDRITPSTYRELLIQVVPDVELAEPKQRADRPLRLGRPVDNHGTAEGRVGEDRITSESNDSRGRYLSKEKPEWSGEGHEEEPAPKKKPKYPNAKTVFAWFPSQEKSWALNTTELKHAELLHERTEEAVRGILAFCRENCELEFFPAWKSPSLLERNWTKIQDFANRNGL